MISICIPVYNLGVAELVDTLCRQSKRLEMATEIVLIDDCSQHIFKEQNKQIQSDIRSIQLEKNIGRAAIRNLFLEHTTHEYLLFLDCDSTILHDDFLQNYIDAIEKYPDCVICGGSEYEKNPPPKNKRLRWEYGSKRECKPIEVRIQDDYNSFLTNNFIISRNQFEAVKFDDNLVHYGHEDTLFGIELKKAGTKILHIDNTVLNGNLSENLEFLGNTEKAVCNLAYILQSTDAKSDLIKNSALLSMYYKLYPFRRVSLLLFAVLGPSIKYILSKGYVNLYLFDFYKLGVLSKKLDKPFLCG